MSRMNVSLVISAQDQTQSAIRSALGGLGRIAQAASKPITIPFKLGGGALALARDINLGLAPLIRGIDSIVDRGTRLQVVTNQFRALSGVGGAQLQVLARQLQVASGNTLRLSDAMQLANRGLSMGVGFKQLVTATEFGVKRAVAMGEDGSRVVEQIINDLGKGTSRVLDDLGLLRNGVEGVKRSYDAIHGSKAFDSLGPAAQKLVLAAEATREMKSQMGAMGVTGKETFFAWQGIKTQVGDTVDKLVQSIATSKGARTAIAGISDTLRGVMEHLDKGLPISEVLFGKGKSGGLAGIAGAAMKDALFNAGFALGRGALASLAAATSKIEAWVDSIVDRIMKKLGLGGSSGGAGGSTFSALGGISNMISAAGGAAGQATSVASAIGSGAIKLAGRARGAAANWFSGGGGVVPGGTPTSQPAAGGWGSTVANEWRNMGPLGKAGTILSAPSAVAVVRAIIGKGATSAATAATAAGTSASSGGVLSTLAGAGSTVGGVATIGVAGVGILGRLLEHQNDQENDAAIVFNQYVRRQALARRRNEASLARATGRGRGGGVGFMPGFGALPIGPMLTMAGVMGGGSDSWWSLGGAKSAIGNFLTTDNAKRGAGEIGLFVDDLLGTGRSKSDPRFNFERWLPRSASPVAAAAAPTSQPASGSLGKLAKFASKLLSIGSAATGGFGWGGTSSAISKFQSEFPPSASPADPNGRLAEIRQLAIDTGIRLSPQTRFNLERTEERLGNARFNYMTGRSTAGMRAMGAANRATRARMGELRRLGFLPNADDRKRIFGEFMEDEQSAGMTQYDAALQGTRNRLASDRYLERHPELAGTPKGGSEGLVKSTAELTGEIRALMKLMQQNIQSNQKVTEALTGASSEVAKAGA